jgi:saccharopine dehydrogenase-like NADP-dependent oxidoreductase
VAKIIILGAGKVGTTMAIDLAADRDVELTLVDRDSAGLARAEARVKNSTGRRIATRQADLSQRSDFDGLIRNADVVIGALSSVLGFRALQWAIEARKPYCDISFMAEDALAHDDLAKEHGSIAIVDCGVAPGMSNLLAGQAVEELDRCDSIAIYVGGIPRERHWPYEYKAGFSPHDVIEEYVRPARLVTSNSSTSTASAFPESARSRRSTPMVCARSRPRSMCRT